MRYEFCQVIVGVGMLLVATPSLPASEDSLGPNGINSLGLGLDGSGIAIGQVEAGRPGQFGYDTDQVNDKVVPAAVYVQDMDAGENDGTSAHALWVASVMISKQTAVDPMTGVSPPIGVAQEANLHSSAFLGMPLPTTLEEQQEDAAITAQHLATLPGIDIRAINMSFGVELASSTSVYDGSSTLTQFIDWSANSNQHDVLYVVAGWELTVGDGTVPSDEFNGMTVAMSGKHPDDGVFREVSTSTSMIRTQSALGLRSIFLRPAF
jgi:hypothetical protein